MQPRRRLHIYSEAVGAWKKLTDTRFALLGLVPAFSVIAWIQLLSSDALSEGLGALFGLLISAAGLTLVEALRTYDRRNDELYNDIISRSRRLELELGVDTGLFLGRPKPKMIGVDHGTAVRRIYQVSTVGWWLVIVWFVVLGIGLV